MARSDDQEHSERGLNGEVIEFEKERRIDSYIRRIAELCRNNPKLAERTEQYLKNEQNNQESSSGEGRRNRA